MPRSKRPKLDETTEDSEDSEDSERLQERIVKEKQKRAKEKEKRAKEKEKRVKEKERRRGMEEVVKEKELRIKEKELRIKEKDLRMKEREQHFEAIMKERDQLLIALNKEVLRVRGLFNVRGTLEHVATLVEQQANETHNTTRTLLKIYDWKSKSSFAKAVVEEVLAMNHSISRRDIGIALADIYRKASTEVHRFQRHDHVDLSGLDETDTVLMKAVCYAIGIEVQKHN